MSNEITNQDGDGTVTFEDVCCGCSLSVSEAVSEREDAVNVSNIDSDSRYALSTLKDAVNDIAPNYVDGEYTGGDSDPPMLSGSYADNAETCDELYSLVTDMLQTKEDGTGEELTPYLGYGRNSNLDTAQTEAENDYQEVSDDTFDGDSRPDGCIRCVVERYHSYYDDYEVEMRNRKYESSIDGLATSIPHNVILFVYPTTPPDNVTNMNPEGGSLWPKSFSKQGVDRLPDENVWGELDSSGETTSSSFDVTWGSTSISDMEWYNVSQDEVLYGWQVKQSDMLFIIEWSFDHV